MELPKLQPIGYQALINLFNLQVVPHYRSSYVSLTGAKRMNKEGDREIHIYPKSYQLSEPNDSFLNLEFAIKHEGMNFAIITLVFEHLSKKQITNYVVNQIHGKAQRKIWYLFEFLMRKKLSVTDLSSGNYIDLLDSKQYYTCNPIKIKRQRINDNLLGFSSYCPFVRRTPALAAFEKKHFDRIAKRLLADYEPLITQRAAAYLYTKETLSSWHIEHEEPTKMRALNFVKLLRKAETLKKLTKKELIQAQHVIVESRFAESDYRTSQNYIAEMVRIDYSQIHYISPSPKDVPRLMNDLLSSLERMIESGVSPVIVAAAISFGFVFIHPFEDGNGRLHRFLIHYILAKNSFTPSGIVFPISAIMLGDRKKYDQVLEHFSRPLMDIITYNEDHAGVISTQNNNAAFYAYLDYTAYAEYLFTCIAKTIEADLRKELDFIIQYDKIKKSMQEVVDMPDKQIDLLMKMVVQNNGKLARAKREKFFDSLTDSEIKKIEAIIQSRNIDVWPH